MDTIPNRQLEKEYPQECVKLAQLCGFRNTNNLPPHLNRIYSVTEAKWEENIHRLVKNNVRIRYLMFGEAAPETYDNDVSYFYNNCQGNWCKAIVEGLIPRHEVPNDTETKLDKLAKRQFLLVDTMPFAVNYSISNRRSKAAYRELVKLCALSYLHKKLFDPRLLWADDILVAFGVKKNAEAMMQAFPNGFPLPNGQNVQVTYDLVATTEANYPHSGRVRQVFKLR